VTSAKWHQGDGLPGRARAVQILPLPGCEYWEEQRSAATPTAPAAVIT